MSNPMTSREGNSPAQMGGRMGLVGGPHEAGNNIARKAWRALKRGTGMHLTAAEVFALHEMEGDGDWWQSFNPANREDPTHG